MKRYNSESDDKELQKYPENDGPIMVQIAHSPPTYEGHPGHWRLVWEIGDGRALRVLESIEHEGEMKFRDSVRMIGISQSMRSYQYTNVKILSLDHREGLVTIASSMDKPSNPSHRCRWFVSQVLREASSIGIISENDASRALLDSRIES
jgi:hypothetical protein